MRTIRTGLAAVAVLGLALTACGGDDDGEGTSSTSKAPEDVVFAVDLDGDAEIPGPGDAEGTGSAEVTVTPGGTEVCYSLTVDGVDDVTAAHIHQGREGVAGPIAITLEAPTSGESEGCASTSSSIVTGLASGDRDFYVNVHSTEFPDGAVRAQLTR